MSFASPSAETSFTPSATLSDRCRRWLRCGCLISQTQNPENSCGLAKLIPDQSRSTSTYHSSTLVPPVEGVRPEDQFYDPPAPVVIICSSSVPSSSFEMSSSSLPEYPSPTLPEASFYTACPSHISHNCPTSSAVAFRTRIGAYIRSAFRSRSTNNSCKAYRLLSLQFSTDRFLRFPRRYSRESAYMPDRESSQGPYATSSSLWYPSNMNSSFPPFDHPVWIRYSARMKSESVVYTDEYSHDNWNPQELIRVLEGQAKLSSQGCGRANYFEEMHRYDDPDWEQEQQQLCFKRTSSIDPYDMSRFRTINSATDNCNVSAEDYQKLLSVK